MSDRESDRPEARLKVTTGVADFADALRRDLPRRLRHVRAVSGELRSLKFPRPRKRN